MPGLTLTVRDERRLPGTPGEEGPVEEVFRHDGGVVDFADFLAPDASVTDTWRLRGTETFTETVQQLDSKGHLRPQDVERACEVEIALRWGIGYDTNVRSFVNIIATPKGGTHQTGFEQGLLKTLRKQIDVNARRLKVSAKEGKVEKDDVLAGLTAVVTVRFPEPQFEGQTKEVLGTAPVRAIVAKVVERELTALLTSTKRHEKVQASALLEKVVGEMRARVSARLHKEISRRKNALETSHAAGQARRLPQRRRRALRAVHRRGRHRPGHGQARPLQRLPGPAAHPRQDPQRPEGLARRHPQERRGAPRSSRSSAPARAGPSTSTRAGTARSCS